MKHAVISAGTPAGRLAAPGWKRALLSLAASVAAFAAEPGPSGGTIDLPTALRLAGANNLDVQIARE